MIKIVEILLMGILLIPAFKLTTNIVEEFQLEEYLENTSFLMILTSFTLFLAFLTANGIIGIFKWIFTYIF